MPDTRISKAALSLARRLSKDAVWSAPKAAREELVTKGWPVQIEYTTGEPPLTFIIIGESGSHRDGEETAMYEAKFMGLLKAAEAKGKEVDDGLHPV